MKLKSLKEIEYLYDNMTTSETIRLKPHLEVIEKELLEFLPEREENTKKLKALEIIKENVDFSLEFDENQNEWFLYFSNSGYYVLAAKGTGIKTYNLLKEVLL